MEEVEDVIRGNVNRWRVERRFVYVNILAKGTLKSPDPMNQMFPLPYDEELEESEGMSGEDILALYKQYEGKL